MTRALSAQRGDYTVKGSDRLTAEETVRLIDHRVAVLLAHWEAERRARESAPWWSRLLARLRRPSPSHAER